jgi:hypothetical protein
MKNTLEHKFWLLDRINDDIEGWNEKAKEIIGEQGTQDFPPYSAHYRFANKARRALAHGVKPSRVEKWYRNIIKTYEKVLK